MKSRFKRIFFIVLCTLGIILIAGYLSLYIYLNADYRDIFIKSKGGISGTHIQFKFADSLFNNYDLTLIDSNGLNINCAVRAPKDSTRKYPALLVMNGFDTGKRVIELFCSTEEAVLLSFDWPYEGQRKFKGADIGPFLPKIRSAIIRAVSVVLTMIDYLESRGGCR